MKHLIVRLLLIASLVVTGCNSRREARDERRSSNHEDRRESRRTSENESRSADYERRDSDSEPHRRRDSGATTPGNFDFYLLALSWAPNFCASHSGPATECAPGRHTGFIVHGLWPQGERGRLDQPCQHASPVAADVVRYALNFYPDAGLVQHEWQCHGVYSGLSARDYFATVGKAFQSLRLPSELTTLSSDRSFDATAISESFAKANAVSSADFATSCHDGELVSVEVCFARDLALRSCPSSQRSCRGSLLLRTPR
jgi:ribonuclease T2